MWESPRFFWFLSTDLTWSLPEDKRSATVKKISAVLQSKHVLVRELQSLIGSLNNLCKMCPFLKIFYFNLNKEMAVRIKYPDYSRELTYLAKNDLLVNTGVLLQVEWLPIVSKPTSAPPSATVFISDAASLPAQKLSGTCEDVGRASVGFDCDGSMVSTGRIYWPRGSICYETDEEGIRSGDKTATP